MIAYSNIVHIYYHLITSPYMFGLSSLIYDSNVLFSTALQSRSLLSAITSSGAAPTVTTGGEMDVVVPAAAPTTPANRSPRAGKLRVGSNGFHLRGSSVKKGVEKRGYVPEVMEMVRVGSFEKPVKAKCFWRSTVLRWSLEEIDKAGPNVRQVISRRVAVLTQ